MARKILLIAGGLVLLLVLTAVLLPFFIDANRFKPQIESAAQTALGRTVTIGNIQLDLFSGGVAVSDISIAEDPAFGSGAFLKAKSVKVGVEMMPLIFSRQLHVTGVAIDRQCRCGRLMAIGTFRAWVRRAPRLRPQVRRLHLARRLFPCRRLKSKTENSWSRALARN